MAVDPDEFAQRYLSGTHLYGDDFGPEEIAAWFADEAEGYSGLAASPGGEDAGYSYYALNELHALRNLPDQEFSRVLGVGSAYGHELLPFVGESSIVTILDPSEVMVNGPLDSRANVNRLRPTQSGEIMFGDDTFDLITCLGVLHHVPNVTFLLSEMYRVLVPGGTLVLREPIVSLGDWRRARAGLTLRERGIPLRLMDNLVATTGFNVRYRSLCVFSLTSRAGRLLKQVPFNSPSLVRVDRAVANAVRPLDRYHAKHWWEKIRPTSVYYVLTRPEVDHPKITVTQAKPEQEVLDT